MLIDELSLIISCLVPTCVVDMFVFLKNVLRACLCGYVWATLTAVVGPVVLIFRDFFRSFFHARIHRVPFNHVRRATGRIIVVYLGLFAFILTANKTMATCVTNGADTMTCGDGLCDPTVLRGLEHLHLNGNKNNPDPDSLLFYYPNIKEVECVPQHFTCDRLTIESGECPCLSRREPCGPCAALPNETALLKSQLDSLAAVLETTQASLEKSQVANIAMIAITLVTLLYNFITCTRVWAWISGFCNHLAAWSFRGTSAAEPTAVVVNVEESPDRTLSPSSDSTIDLGSVGSIGTDDGAVTIEGVEMVAIGETTTYTGRVPHAWAKVRPGPQRRVSFATAHQPSAPPRSDEDDLAEMMSRVRLDENYADPAFIEDPELGNPDIRREVAEKRAKVLAQVERQKLNRPSAPVYPAIQATRPTPDIQHGSLQRYLPEGSTLGMVVGAQKPDCAII